jgi:CMP-N-acetylneuraminic acid synthetase
MNEKILAVIPARGGSKGVPHKNIRLLKNKPLIAYSIEAALEAKDLFHRIIVSTDDEEIANVAKQYGAEVPFIRPMDLGKDTAPMVPVLKHAIEFIEKKDVIKIDWVLLLQPTAPFRLNEDIKNVINLGINGSVDSVISVVQVFSVHPILMKRIENNRLIPFCIVEKEGTRRQDYFPPAYMRNGSLYLSKRDVIMNENSIWGKDICPYIMPENRSVNIDNEFDFKFAEFMLSEE